MKKSLLLEFPESGTRLVTSQAASGAANVFQLVAVNLGTIRGSDPVFPEKGTGFFTSVVRGAIGGQASLQHLAQFAALDTKTFVNDFLPEEEQIEDLTVLTTKRVGQNISTRVDVGLRSGDNFVANALTP